MTTQYTQGTTINKDIVSPFSHNEAEQLDIPEPLQQNMKTRSGIGATLSVIFGSAIFFLGGSGTPNIPEPRAEDTSASIKVSYDEEIESGTTQELADTQVQRLAFPSYNEEDILKLDVVTVAPPPRRSGIIRVKLIHKGRSKPIPIEDPWEA